MSLHRFAKTFQGMRRGNQTPELCAAVCLMTCYTLAGSYTLGVVQGVLKAVKERLPEDQKSCLKFKWLKD